MDTRRYDEGGDGDYRSRSRTSSKLVAHTLQNAQRVCLKWILAQKCVFRCPGDDKERVYIFTCGVLCICVYRDVLCVFNALLGCVVSLLPQKASSRTAKVKTQRTRNS